MFLLKHSHASLAIELVSWDQLDPLSGRFVQQDIHIPLGHRESAARLPLYTFQLQYSMLQGQGWIS